MNPQTDVSGQISGKISSQIATPLSGLPHQNGNSVSAKMQNPVMHGTASITMAERKFMAQNIYEFLKHQHKQSHQPPPEKVSAIVRRLEMGLFESRISKEDYLNMGTLRSRLGVLIKRFSTNSPSQRLQRVNSSPSVCTMIPTPGFQQPGNSNMDGAVASERQSSFSPNARENNMIPSAGVQRPTTQMIPTPGLNNSSDVNNNSNNQSMNMAQPNIRTAFPAVKLSTVSPVAQNSRTLHNLSDPGNRGVKSTLQHNSSGPPNEPVNVSLVSVPGTREGFSTGAMLRNSPKPLHRQLVQHGNGYGTATSNGPKAGNFAPVSCTGLVTNNQCSGEVNMQETTPIISRNESIVDSAQLTISKPHSVNQSSKINFHSQSKVRENLLQPHQSQGKILAQHQTENQACVKANNTFNQSQLSPRPIILSEAKSRPKEYLQPSDANPQNSFGEQGDAALNGCQRDFRPHDVSHGSRRLPLDHGVQDVFYQRLNGQDVAQLNNISSEESVSGQSHAGQVTRVTEPLNMSKKVCQPSDVNDEKLVTKQRNWLITLGHARQCPSQEGKCQEPRCDTFKKLSKHMEQCPVFECTLPKCRFTKNLLLHYKSCHDANCGVCVFVKNKTQTQRLREFATSDFKSEFPGSVEEGSCKSHNISEVAGRSTTKKSQFLDETREDFNPPTKRMKIEVAKVDVEVPERLGEIDNIFKKKKDNLQKAKQEGAQVPLPNPSGQAMQEVVKHGEIKQVKLETEIASNPGKPKITGVSMTEFFTPEQVRQHIKGLRQWIRQSKTLQENIVEKPTFNESVCQLCLNDKLTFEPPPLYCTPCGARVKRNAMYYTAGTSETRNNLCIPCYNEARGGSVTVDGSPLSKARMEKKRNDEESGESWVQCDKCEAWQHQICALFNGKRNDCGQAEYICPFCYIEEVERGQRVPLPLSAVLGAKDLPRTFLSDHLEQRLFAKLEQERHDRAMSEGKSYDEVPEAESLVVRVVSSVDKKMEVKQQFLQLFKEENYPSEFPYKSKVILLFQKIEGVEVCLFGMYVQEYGSECQQPNNRRVYISYLDSVKYFRPEVKAVTGEALRTFVYHEILIGYLEYCKGRGFTSCYIWACPPLKGEDYILYCHPEIQKTPKADKLREWYMSMLQKASEENIVVGITNLYEHFFASNDECKAKITASRLPYFDGDYWPGAAEDVILQLQQGAMKKTVSKRALKSSGHTHFSDKASKDLLLMHQLGEVISPMKEDFILVHLRYACKRCCIPMVSGKSWVCKECINFQLCDKCHETEQKCEVWERHPINQKGIHALYPVEVNDIPLDTKDKDEILESEFFDTRQAFLSLCQGNHYQYDTLRRAKHSSMNILYHLHNPSAPAFVATCNMCHVDIANGQGFRCSTCDDYDVCNSCYQKGGGRRHPHALTNYSANDCNAQNIEARALRVIQLKKMLQLMVHASQCRLTHCQTQGCLKVKGIYRHGMTCKTRVIGGCDFCRKMWSLLHLHARSCKESACTVPRCRELKEHLKLLKYQSETRRRAAVNEMIRQRRA